MSALERMLDEFAAQATPAPARLAAAQALRAGALPTRRDENWRYANLRALESVSRFAPAPPAAHHSALPRLPAALPGFTRLVLVDGRLHPEWPLPEMAQLARLPFTAPLTSDSAASAFEATGDGRMGLIARMFAPAALSLRVRGNLALEIISFASVGAHATYTDIAVELEPGVQLELVERQLGDAPVTTADRSITAFSCGNLQLLLGAGAQLVHTRLQQAPDNILLYDTATATLAERANYQLRHIAAGGASARSTLQIRLAGRDATVAIRALAAARGAQFADAQFTVLHQAPGTRSDQLFRGIASERAHVACTADVQVTPGAPGARVLQSLRGLIDGKGAEVDLRPRLTINTDDIQAAHGATTGRLDEDLLFYLLSRGLAPEAARSLLKWAFLGEALSAVGPPALRRDAQLASAARLGDAPAAELLQ